MKKLYLTTLSLLWAAALWGAEPADFSGKLYRQGSQQKELLFTLKAGRQSGLYEDHYYDAQGADAVIERVYLKDGQAQRYEYDDRQQKGLGSLEIQGSKLQLRWEQDGNTKTRTVDAPDDLTFGPLYPLLLQKNFEALLKGGKVFGTVPVLSQAHLMTAQLAFQRRPQLEHGDGKVCISMKPANWFVALFFPPIDLYFDEKTRVLEDVHGTSLLKEKIKDQWQLTKVDLFYQY